MAAKKSNTTTNQQQKPIKLQMEARSYSLKDLRREATEDAFRWFMRLMVDRRIKVDDLNSRLRETLSNAEHRLDVAVAMYEHAPSHFNLYEIDYAKEYLKALSEFIRIEEPVRKIPHSQLSDFFIDSKMTFEDFQNIIEKARITTKGKMMVSGTSYRAIGTFDALKELEILYTHDWVDYRNCFTKNYINRIYHASTYTNARDDDKGQIKRCKDSFIRAYKMLSEPSL